MDPMIGALLKVGGPLAILAAMGFYLYFKERSINQRRAEQDVLQITTFTEGRFKVAAALEDLAVIIKTVETTLAASMENCQSTVKALVADLRQDRAREEGRREATDPHIRIPKRKEEAK